LNIGKKSSAQHSDHVTILTAGWSNHCPQWLLSHTLPLVSIPGDRRDRSPKYGARGH